MASLRYIAHSFAQALIGATILMVMVSGFDIIAARMVNSKGL